MRQPVLTLTTAVFSALFITAATPRAAIGDLVSPPVTNAETSVIIEGTHRFPEYSFFLHPFGGFIALPVTSDSPISTTKLRGVIIPRLFAFKGSLPSPITSDWVNAQRAQSTLVVGEELRPPVELPRQKNAHSIVSTYEVTAIKGLKIIMHLEEHKRISQRSVDHEQRLARSSIQAPSEQRTDRGDIPFAALILLPLAAGATVVGMRKRS